MSNRLDSFKSFDEIKKMNFKEIDEFASEIREFLINKVSKTGGHLASNLGVVELTLSLYYAFDFNKDKLVFDVGHQAYVHKILTGRKDEFNTLRQYGGLSGFPKYNESIYDSFETGHSSTSISAALGMARARDLAGEKHEVVALIGDGALTGGMALEALNDAGFSKTKMIIVLNDNQMSIGKNVGGVSVYLSKLRLDPKYNKFKEDLNSTLRKIPNIGNGVANSIEKLKDGLKQIMVPGMLFEDMGIKYLGPIDGHNIRQLTQVMTMAKAMKGPVLIHVMTKKGKGYEYAESNPGKFHGIGPFDCDSGELLSKCGTTYSQALGQEMVNLAESNNKIVAVTAAMRDGTGLKDFSKTYPSRFFDVGIAEQHAVTMCAGLAKSGFKPVFAVYSTFLQRAYDQILHDVCLQKLPVILAIDRAGIVGEDGETHQGVFDISYLSHMPNMTIMTPKCTEELRYMLRWSMDKNFPIAIRYPRGGDNSEVNLKPCKSFTLGKWEVMSGGEETVIIAAGQMVSHSKIAVNKLKERGYDITLINACFLKPIDEILLKKISNEYHNIITIEDNVLHGGLGDMVLQYMNTLGYKGDIYNLGYKDEFIPHGKPNILYKKYGLDSEGIFRTILSIVSK